jgi:hypothetical protein
MFSNWYPCQKIVTRSHKIFKRNMKKIILGICLLTGLFVAQTASAQYKKGDKLLNIGIGLNSYYSAGTPIGASLEVGVTDAISVGGMIDYVGTSYAYAGGSTSFSALYIGARGSYHFNELLNLRSKQWDIYGGASLGYRSFSWSDTNIGNGLALGGSYGSGVFLGIHVGTRYYFSDKVGAFLELGGGGSGNARLGVAFKF